VELQLSSLALPKYIAHIISEPSRAANVAGQTHLSISDTGARGNRCVFEKAKNIALQKYDVDVLRNNHRETITVGKV